MGRDLPYALSVAILGRPTKARQLAHGAWGTESCCRWRTTNALTGQLPIRQPLPKMRLFVCGLPERVSNFARFVLSHGGGGFLQYGEKPFDVFRVT
jgi:hypothetical protein